MYSEQTVSSITDIPSRILAFAADRGWTVAGNTLTRPGGGITWTIEAAILTFGYHTLRCFQQGEQREARTCLPRLRGTSNNPEVFTPSKLHLFGNEAPFDGPDSEPYIAAVIECGYNHYRHVYIGSVRKFGQYDGGDCIDMNYFDQGYSPNSTTTWSDTDNKGLFSCRHAASGTTTFSAPTGRLAGGVLIDHPDNANPWRQFDGPTSGTNGAMSYFDGTEVFGGSGDGPNDGLMYRGRSDYAGSNVLVPINLYCPDGNYGVDFRIRPVGMVCGVRMVNMESLEPGASVQVGNENWRVFPEFRKTYTTSYAATGGNAYRDDETSYMLGLAYPEG